MGRLGYRRVMHFWPDGKTEIHGGSTCICDVIYILDTLRFAPYDYSPNEKLRQAAREASDCKLDAPAALPPAHG
jgi:hypothetical protein